MSKQEDTILLIHQMILQNNGEPDWTAIGEAIGKSSEAARSYYRRHSDKYVGEFREVNSVSINEDGSQTSDRLVAICEEERKDPIRLLQLHNYDPNEWILVNARDNLWHMKESEGRIMLYQSKITARPKGNNDFSVADIDKFFENYSSSKQSKFVPVKQYDKDAEVLEIDLADIHMGKRIYWGNQMSVEDRIKYTIDDIINRCKHRTFSKIYFVPLGDIAHFDNKNRTTTKGTSIESDGMWLTEIFDTIANLFFWSIDGLLEIAPVEYPHLPGNHDWFVSYSIAKSLEFYYRNNKNVTVDASYLSRKWRLIGITLLGWAHGEMNRSNQFSWLMSEAREAWGKSKYAEVHQGHLHTQKADEKNGMILRHVSSINGTDEWTYDKGWTGNVEGTTSYVWCPERALREVWHTNILT